MLLVEKTVKDFVAQVASNEPAPGGGSVSALAASLGAALTSMVGELTVGRKKYEALSDDEKKIVDDSLAATKPLIERLNELVDEDTNAFNDFMEALKMPKETDEEKAARSDAMQEGIKKAIVVPLDAAKTALEILKLSKPLAVYGNQNAITDAGVGALLACAGVEGAAFNVLINLGDVKDQEYVESMKKECKELVDEAKALRDEVVKVVYDALLN